MATGLIMPVPPTTPDPQGLRNYHSSNQLFYPQNSRPGHARSSSASSDNNYYRCMQASPWVPTATTTPTAQSPSASAAALRMHRPSLTTAIGPTYSSASALLSTTGLLGSASAPPAPSPTSPRSYHARQVRPLYIPAALRPNDEFPSRPPACCSRKEERWGERDSLLRRSSSSLMSIPGLSVIGHKLSRRCTDESLKQALADLDLDLFPTVSALPTKNHWKPDSESAVCDDPSCLRAFSYLNRRHHCRRCGNIFCDPHSAFAVPLDEDARFNPRGSPSRACAHCFGDFKSWRSRNSSIASSAASSAAASVSMPATPTETGCCGGMAIPAVPGLGVSPLSPGDASTDSALATAQPHPHGHGHGHTHTPALASSVPSDWDWSTF